MKRRNHSDVRLNKVLINLSNSSMSLICAPWQQLPRFVYLSSMPCMPCMYILYIFPALSSMPCMPHNFQYTWREDGAALDIRMIEYCSPLHTT